MTLNITWSGIMAALAGISIAGVGLGIIGFYAVRAYRQWTQKDRLQINQEIAITLANWKSLYESEKEKNSHQLAIFRQELLDLRNRIRQLEDELTAYKTKNIDLQAMICRHRIACIYANGDISPSAV